MNLLSIELENFRNFEALGLALDARGAVVEAPNGRGKTNFLEAIHYLSLFRSFRGAPDAELASFGTRGFRLRAELGNGDGSPRGLGIAVEGARKRLAVDGREVRLADHVGEALSVVLTPSDIRLVQGSPARRRRYLDVILALSSRRYLVALQDYGRVVKHRNRLLQRGEAQARPALLEPWSEQLVSHGSAILLDRRRFLARWGGRFREISSRLAGTPEAGLAWSYRSTARLPAEADDRDELARVLRAELDRFATAERRRGLTLVGPHRDDLAIHAAPSGGVERDLRKFGSQGEQRTAALALRFLETEVLTHERGQIPIVLLDDVFSELDPRRSREVLQFLAPGQQVFLTTPKPLPRELALDLPRYGVSAGSLRLTP